MCRKCEKLFFISSLRSAEPNIQTSTTNSIYSGRYQKCKPSSLISFIEMLTGI